MSSRPNLHSSNYRLIFFILLFAFLLVACNGGSPEPPDGEPTEIPDNTPLVSATGKVVPEKWAALSTPKQGVVVELLVEENQFVTEGQTLLRLDGAEDQQAALTAAKLELVRAQQARDRLDENAALVLAETRQDLANAEKELALAEGKLKHLTTPTPQWHIDQAYANLVLAENQLVKARDDVARIEKKLANQGSDRWFFISRRVFRLLLTNLQKVEADTQRRYNDALEKYNDMLEPVDEIDLAVAEADVSAAQARVNAAEQDLEVFLDGPDPEEVAKAEARLQAARLSLEASRNALQDLELKAPFDGTVSAVYVRENEWVGAGQQVLLLGDLDKLRVESTDLNEVDVAVIQLGDVATVTFDALPQIEVTGNVVSIAPKASQGSGVNYTVIIDLSEIPEQLLWDMTAFVDIEVDQVLE
jgi:HlyD family secretion protein